MFVKRTLIIVLVLMVLSTYVYAQAPVFSDDFNDSSFPYFWYNFNWWENGSTSKSITQNNVSFASINSTSLDWFDTWTVELISAHYESDHGGFNEPTTYFIMTAQEIAFPTDALYFGVYQDRNVGNGSIYPSIHIGASGNCSPLTGNTTYFLFNNSAFSAQEVTDAIDFNTTVYFQHYANGTLNVFYNNSVVIDVIPSCSFDNTWHDTIASRNYFAHIDNISYYDYIYYGNLSVPPVNCTPNWVCSGYADCISPMNDTVCNDVIDQNACGESYTGNYSEFLSQLCSYPQALFTNSSNMTCHFAANPYLKTALPFTDRDRIDWLCSGTLLSDCVSYVEKDGGILQTNPDIRSVKDFGNIVSFTTRGASERMARVYFRTKDLYAGESYNFKVECNIDNSTEIAFFEANVTPSYKPLDQPVNYGAWYADGKSGYIILMIIGIFVLIGAIIFVVRKLKGK